jgi:pyruvate/2-oxoglutarate dehydrogenase complex dihydrolipoamide acyltransferase (E2) component
MSKRSGYRSVPVSFNRRMVAISASMARQRNTIHSITDVDISVPRAIMREYRERTGERLSLTAYIVKCLSQTVSEFPAVNSFRKGRRFILLEDVTVSVLVERQVRGEKVPEPFGIREAQKKSYRQIHEEIRAAQRESKDQLGSLSGLGWVRFIPGFLMRLFFRVATRNIRMQIRYGVISVTAVGMFARDAVWFVPMGGPSVLVTVGSIINKPVIVNEELESREHLCLTVSFDHNITDGAPAARFVSRFTEILRSGELLEGAATDQ